MLVVAFNFKESESNKKTLNEWPGKEEVFDQGAFMMTMTEGGGEHLWAALRGE